MPKQIRAIQSGQFATSINAGTIKPIAFQPIGAVLETKPFIGQLQPQLDFQPVVAMPQPVIKPGLSPGVIKLFDRPALTTLLPKLVIDMPIPRNKVSSPISPTQAVAADTIFQDPKNRKKRYILPKHQLAQHQVDNQLRYKIWLETGTDQNDSPIWVLTLELDRLPLAKGLTALAESAALVLMHRLRPDTSQIKEHVFQAVEADGLTQWKLLLDNINARDQVVRALQESDFAAQLLLRYSVKIALPEPKQAKRPQLYRQVQKNIDVPVGPDPFLLAPNLHGYLYRNVDNVSQENFGYLRHVFEDQVYYQDEATPEVFNYLPDLFKVERRDEPPFAPNMLVRFSSADGSLDNMQATLEYVATPVTDLARLERARDHLIENARIKLSDRQKERMTFQMLPVTTDQIRFEMSLPRQSGGDLWQERANVVLDIGAPFVDLLDFSIEQFRVVYEALMGASAILFSGRITVKVDEENDEIIPVKARFDDLHGELFSVSEQFNPATSAVEIEIVNEAESPVQINEIPVSLLTEAGELISGNIGRLVAITSNTKDEALPVTLGPRESLRFEVVASTDFALKPDMALDAIFDLDDVTVLPDKRAIYDQILDPAVPAEYMRDIQVQAFDTMFAPATDVQAVLLDFPGDSDVLVTAASLQHTARLRTPLATVILNEETDPIVPYRMTIVRTNGTQETVERSVSSNFLIPVLG